MSSPWNNGSSSAKPTALLTQNSSSSTTAALSLNYNDKRGESSAKGDLPLPLLPGSTLWQSYLKMHMNFLVYFQKVLMEMKLDEPEQWKDDSDNGTAAMVTKNYTVLSTMESWKLRDIPASPHDSSNWNPDSPSRWQPKHCRLTDRACIYALLTLPPKYRGKFLSFDFNSNGEVRAARVPCPPTVFATQNGVRTFITYKSMGARGLCSGLFAVPSNFHECGGDDINIHVASLEPKPMHKPRNIWQLGQKMNMPLHGSAPQTIMLVIEPGGEMGFLRLQDFPGYNPDMSNEDVLASTPTIDESYPGYTRIRWDEVVASMKMRRHGFQERPSGPVEIQADASKVGKDLSTENTKTVGQVSESVVTAVVATTSALGAANLDSCAPTNIDPRLTDTTAFDMATPDIMGLEDDVPAGIATTGKSHSTMAIHEDTPPHGDTDTEISEYGPLDSTYTTLRAQSLLPQVHPPGGQCSSFPQLQMVNTFALAWGATPFESLEFYQPWFLAGRSMLESMRLVMANPVANKLRMQGPLSKSAEKRLLDLVEDSNDNDNDDDEILKSIGYYCNSASDRRAIKDYILLTRSLRSYQNSIRQLDENDPPVRAFKDLAKSLDEALYKPTAEDDNEARVQYAQHMKIHGKEIIQDMCKWSDKRRKLQHTSDQSTFEDGLANLSNL
ncbi:unnamed protein product [Penicillium bialowiezense]